MIGADDLFSASHLFDPARLTVARELKGLTKTELAELVEKTPSALSQFEAGRARPDPQTLRRIALALGLPIAFFTRRRTASLIPLDACHFRSLRSATQRDRRRLLAIAMLLCELVAEVEDFVELPVDQISPLAAAAATSEDIEELATQVPAFLGPRTRSDHKRGASARSEGCDRGSHRRWLRGGRTHSRSGTRTDRSSSLSWRSTRRVARGSTPLMNSGIS